MNSKFEAVMDGLVEPGGPGAAVAVRQGDQTPYVAGDGPGTNAAVAASDRRPRGHAGEVSP